MKSREEVRSRPPDCHHCWACYPPWSSLLCLGRAHERRLWKYIKTFKLLTGRMDRVQSLSTFKIYFSILVRLQHASSSIASVRRQHILRLKPPVRMKPSTIALIVTPIAMPLAASAICPGYNYGVGNAILVGNGVNNCMSWPHPC